MLQQSNSILRLCIVVVVVMLVQLLPVLSQDVKIGTQTWTSKNLDVSTFRNGDPIPEVKSANKWDYAGDNKQPAWCYYEYDSENGKVYGKLYNWYAVNDPRGLAPKGYHIPSDAEWTILTDMLGGEDLAGQKMKSTTGWSNNGRGNIRSDFNGLPGGGCNDNGYFYGITVDGSWWSSSEDYANNAWFRDLFFSNTKVLRSSNFKSNGFSVRCLRD